MLITDNQSSMKNNIDMEYFLNAIHYCIWRIYMEIGSTIGKITDKMLKPIPKYFFTKDYRKKYYKRLPNEKKKTDIFLHNKNNGYYIGLANSFFGEIYSGYPCFISFVSVGFTFRESSEFNYCKIMILLAIPIGLAFIPAYKAVFANDRYLEYFKKFAKEDEKWHKKWKRRTIAFCTGSIIATLLGICTAFAIAIL